MPLQKSFSESAGKYRVEACHDTFLHESLPYPIFIWNRDDAVSNEVALQMDKDELVKKAIALLCTKAIAYSNEDEGVWKCDRLSAT